MAEITVTTAAAEEAAEAAAETAAEAAAEAKVVVAQEEEEAGAAAEAEAAAQEEAEVEVAITINLSAVLTYKVMTAKSKADVVFTSMWLVCGIFFAAVGIIALLAIGVASQWPHCLEQDCRAGMVCVSKPKQPGSSLDYRDGTDGFTVPACEDCYDFTDAQTNGEGEEGEEGEEIVAVGVLFNTTDRRTPTDVCLNQLNEHNASIYFASKQPASFARCLYIQHALGKVVRLDRVMLYIVFLLVAMSMAEDQRQQQLMCRLRRILLPLWPLRPKKETTGSILRWLGILLLTIFEFVISLAAPLLPFGTVFLMLTQGLNVQSAVLNGLAMGFVLQIDNLVPSIFFSPKVLARIETYLVAEAVREMAKKDAGGFYGYITASPFIAVATVFMGLFSQLYVLDASRSIDCSSLIYMLHYRATIFFGLWCTGALCFAIEEGTRAIIGRQQRLRSPGSSRAIINEDAPIPSASGVPKWVAPVLSKLVAVTRRFFYLLIAALILNFVFLYLAVTLYFEIEFKATLDFDLPVTSLVFDLFGTCAQGFSHDSTGCVPL